MAQERHSNLGYIAFKKETTKGTAVVPNVYVPAYSEDLTTNWNLIEDNPIVGNKFARFQVLPGLRGHTGNLTVMGEPNTIGYLFDMLLRKGSTTGSDPYTHPFTLSTTNPNSYTMDISYVSHVVRFFGVEASAITPTWESGEMRPEVTVSALKSWAGRTVASVSGSGPYDVVFDTDYDPRPTDGLVVGDLLQFYDYSESAIINAIVDGIDSDGVTIEVSENVAALAAGDYCTLRPATPSFSLLTPFLWQRTEFRFGADAAAALTATHTPLEQDSNWAIMHPFEEDEGSKRSGSFDPASLPRMQGDAEFNARVFFDTPEQLQRWLDIQKRAVVIRHFSGTGYELRVTLNNVRVREGAQPHLEAEGILYSDLNFAPTLDTGDGQALDVKVLNAVSSI